MHLCGPLGLVSVLSPHMHTLVVRMGCHSNALSPDLVHWRLRLLHSAIAQASQPTLMTVTWVGNPSLLCPVHRVGTGQVVAGLDEGLLGMKVTCGKLAGFRI